MGRLSRNKGAEYEREIARELRDIFGDASRRGFQYRDGTEAGDVLNPVFFIECKRHKRCDVKKALEQAIANCNDKTKYPIAVTRDDNKRSIVTMDLEDFKDLVREWWELKAR